MYFLEAVVSDRTKLLGYPSRPQCHHYLQAARNFENKQAACTITAVGSFCFAKTTAY
jgi:hypothetical protein